MRALTRLLFATALCAPLLPGCKKDGGTTRGPGSDVQVQAPEHKPGMPRPYRVPGQLDLALHVQAPAQMIDVMAAHVPGAPASRDLVAETIGRFGPFERSLATHVDLSRPWDAAWVEQQLVVQIPIMAASASQVEGLLANKAPVGKFGAVDLGRGAQPGPKLAWYDRETSMLTLADDERGLATGREVATALAGKPVYFTTTADQAKSWGALVGFSRIEVSGTGTDALDIHIDDLDPEHLARLGDLRDGALTGLLENPKIAAGVSSRYAHYARDVKSLMSQGQRTVDDVPFLVRGNAEDLLRRVGSVVRSWNGRVMVGVGPKQHLLLGLGTDDAKKTGGAFAHMMNGVMSNLSLAKSFVSLPTLRWKKDKASAGGLEISAVALEGAKRYLPPELHPLVNGEGDLRVAMAFSPRMGAMMIVAGPGCVSVLQDWIAASERATPATDSAGDFITATVALEAPAVRSLLASGTAANPATALQLDATRAPTKVVVRRKDAAFDISVRGPKLEGTAPARTASSGAPTRTTKPAAPTRTTAPRGKGFAARRKPL